METFDDQYKNLYIIKRKLSDLKRLDYGHYEYWVGNRFTVKLFTHRIQDSARSNPNERVTAFEKVDIVLDEVVARKEGMIFTDRISLDKDPRFKDYKPIKYGGHNGDLMPISHVCELIKYLHRLDDLKAFE